MCRPPDVRSMRFRKITSQCFAVFCLLTTPLDYTYFGIGRVYSAREGIVPSNPVRRTVIISGHGRGSGLPFRRAPSNRGMPILAGGRAPAVGPSNILAPCKNSQHEKYNMSIAIKYSRTQITNVHVFL